MNRKVYIRKEINHENEQFNIRKLKLEKLKKTGNPFPNSFKPNIDIKKLKIQYSKFSKKTLQFIKRQYKISGRITSKRIIGKASFYSIQNIEDSIQIYFRKEQSQKNMDKVSWDIGDIIGVEGKVFKTNTGELSLFAESIILLTKSLRSIPNKFYGLLDKETRFRKRYLDLITNKKSQEIFKIRFKIIQKIREYFIKRKFIEVETPMLQNIASGAIAKPFITYHNNLNMKIFLRIAPELYLKRLIIGGFEKIFEVNRNFRNEGISKQHNPEFTMLEFYQAYADYNDLIKLTEDLICNISNSIFGSTIIKYQENIYDFGVPFNKMTMLESILKYLPEVNINQLSDEESAKKLACSLQIKIDKNSTLGKIQADIFEKYIEHKLCQPTFITEYPIEVSPLARKNEKNPLVTDRFEFFIDGKEIANGFSELNDSEDQKRRFLQQINKDPDDQMQIDKDYIEALEYGLPPTAGEGIGIDRLVMIFTNCSSIREVLLFPHMKN